MRIAIVTDAWAPQVNGVVRTLESVIAELRAQGQAVPAELADRIREEAAAALEAEMDNLPV